MGKNRTRIGRKERRSIKLMAAGWQVLPGNLLRHPKKPYFVVPQHFTGVPRHALPPRSFR